MSAPAAIIVHPMASPSRPSVRFTALLDPTITSMTKTMNGKKATSQSAGLLPKRFDHQIRTKSLQERHHAAAWNTCPCVCITTSATAISDARRNLQAQLGPRGESQVAAVHHLDVVVGKSDRAEGQVESIASQTKGLLRSDHSRVGTRIEMQISTPPIVGVPAFF